MKVQEVQSVQVKKYDTKQLTMDALFVALTFVFTMFIHIQIPFFGGSGGLIHLGNIPLFVGAILFGKRTGAIAGGIGMMLFDVLSGWILWAPCTLITCAAMGYAVGSITEHSKKLVVRILAMLLALVIKLTGYFVFESFVLGNGMAAAVKSVPGNVIQVTVAIVIVCAIVTPIEKIKRG